MFLSTACSCETSCNNGLWGDSPFLTFIHFWIQRKMGYLMSYISLKCKTVSCKNREISVWKNGPSPVRPLCILCNSGLLPFRPMSYCWKTGLSVDRPNARKILNGKMGYRWHRPLLPTGRMGYLRHRPLLPNGKMGYLRHRPLLPIFLKRLKVVRPQNIV